MRERSPSLVTRLNLTATTLILAHFVYPHNGVIPPAPHQLRIVGASQFGDGLRPRTDQHRATEVDVAVHALEPRAGAGTPDLRPHRLTPNGAGATAPTPLICAAQPRQLLVV